MLNRQRVSRLLDRARRDVEEGLLPACQVALGYEGELAVDETFGEADPSTRFAFFSATKPLVAAAIWALIGDGKVKVRERVAAIIPEFATHGKDAVTIEQLMLHTAGFPWAPLGPPTWETREGRVRAFAAWRLNWEPGTRYEYHPTSAHWVLAEIIDRVTGGDFRDVVEARVTEPAGLPRLLGLGSDDQQGIATLKAVGEHATPDEIEAVLGVRELPTREVDENVLLFFNEPAARAVGVPGGGGFGRAADLALFYQAVLHNPGGIWDAAVLDDARSRVRNRFPEPLLQYPANRTLGFTQAGDDGLMHLRGFGRTVSPRTIGHNGAGGQIAWLDPDSGLSFAFITNGLDRHAFRGPRRGAALSSLAGRCAEP